MKKMNKKFFMASISFVLMVVIAAALILTPEILDLTASKTTTSESLAQQDESIQEESVEVVYKGIGFSVFEKNTSNNGKKLVEESLDDATLEAAADTKTSQGSVKNEKQDKTNTSKNSSSTTGSSSESSSSSEKESSTSTAEPETQSSQQTEETPTDTTTDDPAPVTVEEPKEEPVADTVETPKETPVVEPEVAEETKPDTEAGAFYVSKSGNDANPGTEAEPWKTIQKAASTLKAGQTVYVKEGTYNERVTLRNSGTSGNYITFTNYPGDRVVVDGAGIDWGYNWQCLFNTNGKDYIKVNGFRVINSRWAGIGSEDDYDSGNHVIISNNSTYNTKASGIAFYNASNITVEGNSVEKACTAQGSQEAISICNVNTFTIRNNKVFNITNSVQGAGGEGIDAKNGSSNGKIYNNTVHDIAKIGIYVDAYKRTSSNIQVYGNSVYNCGEGITIATEKGGLLKNVNIYSNSIRNCKNGFSIAGWENGYSHDMDTIKFNSNTISGATSRGIYLNNADARNVYITKNTISGSSSMIPIHLNGGLLSETTIDGNIFDREIDLALAGTNYTFN